MWLITATPLIPEKRDVCSGTGGGMVQKEGKERDHREQQVGKRMSRAHDVRWGRRAG